MPILCLYIMYLGLWSNSCVPAWCLSLSVNMNSMRAWTGPILVLSVQFIFIEWIIDSIWLLVIASSPISFGLALLYFICYVAKQNKILKHILSCHVPTHPSKRGKVWTSLHILCFHDLVPTNISSLIYFCCSSLSCLSFPSFFYSWTLLSLLTHPHPPGLKFHLPGIFLWPSKMSHDLLLCLYRNLHV